MDKLPKDCVGRSAVEPKPDVGQVGLERPDTKICSIEEELREAITARDNFLAIVAHELRNPLTPFLLCVQLLRAAQEAGNTEKAAAELNRLERLANHFSSRALMLLNIAQITTKQFQFEFSELNLSELVVGIVGDYAPLATRAGSEITMSIQAGIVGLIDKMAVSEIVENLLSNAIKYGRGKPVHIA
ncbi:MAG: sensor histidine kinase, partial [Candidatus Binataceae bacterium]